MNRWPIAPALWWIPILLSGCGDDDGGANERNDNRNGNQLALCGNGRVDLGEECDDGTGNSDLAPDACRSGCQRAWCGDGVIDASEACDDGPGNSDLVADACRSSCAPPRCGDGVTDTGEACDDGPDNSDTIPDACRTSCRAPRCGDGVIDAPEGCDDGTAMSDVLPDACRTDCREAHCGDGVLDTGEGCDGGPLGDGCEAACTVMEGWACAGSPSDCTPICGDGLVLGPEACDDGGTVDWDGCTGCIVTEFRVNAHTTGNQLDPAVAATADGSFVVVWQGDGPGGTGADVYAQRFRADGAAGGAAIRVSTYTLWDQDAPRVAMADDGGFVVVWQSFAQDGGDTGVFAQRFAADGSPAGGELRINGQTASFQYSPAVAMAADGRFVVAWCSNLQDGSSLGVYARRYAADGSPAGAELRVNTYTTNVQETPAVAMADDGRFVVVWRNVPAVLGQSDVQAQRFAADGTADGIEWRVNTFTGNDQEKPAIGMAGDGRFVVVWQSAGQDGQGAGLFGQRFGMDGAAAGSELQINAWTTGTQESPAVSMADDGRFVVVWKGNGAEGTGAYARPFAADGTPVRAELRVHQWTLNSVAEPAVSVLPDGRFVVAWDSQSQDGQGYGIFAQRFAPDGAAAGVLPWP